MAKHMLERVTTAPAYLLTSVSNESLHVEEGLRISPEIPVCLLMLRKPHRLENHLWFQALLEGSAIQATVPYLLHFLLVLSLILREKRPNVV